jgi:Rubrerythrin
MDSAVVAAADFNARHWQYEKPGEIRIGSADHLQMLCRVLLETYNPYKPAVIEWPKLDADALRRITALPIWDIAVQTEIKAGLRIDSFAETVNIPDLRKALFHMAGEEKRHHEVLSHMVRAYGIELHPEPTYPKPRDPEWAFMVTGFSECIDSFFAYGLFEVARQSGFFPIELVDTFEPVVQEEGRHILFFMNWFFWYRANMAWWRRPWFALKTIAVWGFLFYERIGIARGIDDSGQANNANFTVNGSEALADEMDLGKLIRICLAEDKRRMAGYDARLRRPRLMPLLAGIAAIFIRPKAAPKAAKVSRA